MDTESVFSVLAFAFSLGFYLPYVRGVWRGTVEPTISGWIAWLAMDFAILAGMVAAGHIAWQMVAYVVGCVAVIGVCTYRKMPLGWTMLDTLCVSLTAVAIGLWSITRDPNADIVLSNVAITIGTVPFFLNVWRKPEREPLIPWLMIWIGGICGNIAITEWSVADALTPVWFLVIQTGCVFLIGRKLFPKHAAA